VRPRAISEEVTEAVEAICNEVGTEHMRMVSVAAHDAMNVAKVAPAGLFFIPSLKGISHRPDEDSRREDIILAGEILYKWAEAEIDRVF
jgi:N-carbamoyl-L-amino-acid hydrolase